MTDGTSLALFAAAAGESLYRWYDSQKFCGRCGARMEKSAVERAMVCPHCKNTVYPKICPAVIVAVQAALPYSGTSFSVMELTDAPAVRVIGSAMRLPSESLRISMV